MIRSTIRPAHRSAKSASSTSHSGVPPYLALASSSAARRRASSRPIRTGTSSGSRTGFTPAGPAGRPAWTGAGRT